ncbi:MAG: HAMP domain-containing protein [Oxalobacter sp.]|nr:MAG: HAMP domain-containing protein [Oxalobacter sp.]
MKNLKIGFRLGLGFIVVLALSVVITAMGVLQIKFVSDMTMEMAKESVVKERLASDWSNNINAAVMRTTAIAKSNDASLAKFFAKASADSVKATTALIKKIEALLETPPEKKVYGQLVEIRKAYSSSRDAVAKLKAEGKAEEAQKMLESTFIPNAELYQKKVSEFLAIQRTSLDEKAAAIEKADMASRIRLTALGAIVVVFGLFAAWWLTRGITRPLKEAVKVAETVASGDLTTHIDVQSKDETGQLLQALKNMNDSLKNIVGRVRTGSNALATAASQIAAGNQDLSSRTEEQASSLEETASSMEELTATVRQNGDNANQANQLAVAASDVASKGGTIVSDVVQMMDAINGSSRKMVDIINVIDGIAFQTNILALNAAVEAARAGEDGRGFAVVATEVRNLAQRSAAAAREIKSLIDDSVSKIESGSTLVHQAGGTMNEIVSSIRRVTDIMGEIAAATREQVDGIEQVNQAVGQMDQVTQQNAALVEEAAAAAESMQNQTAEFVQLVSVFNINEPLTA